MARKTKEQNAKLNSVFYFWFCDSTATSIASLKKAIKNVPIDSIEHHSSNHDFSKWVSDIKGKVLAKKISKAEISDHGEILRKNILKSLS